MLLPTLTNTPLPYADALCVSDGRVVLVQLIPSLEYDAVFDVELAKKIPFPNVMYVEATLFDAIVHSIPSYV